MERFAKAGGAPAAAGGDDPAPTTVGELKKGAAKLHQRFMKSFEAAQKGNDQAALSRIQHHYMTFERAMARGKLVSPPEGILLEA